MNLLDPMARLAASPSRQIFGVVIAVVTNNKDKQGLGRVRVKFPSLGDASESAWARVATPMAGNGRGVYFLPEVDDEVLVAFEHGDPAFPYVIGSLWNGKDKPPADNGDGKNSVRVIRSKSGHTIRLTDAGGSEKIEIIDKTGENKLVIDSAANSITISAPKGKLKLEGQEIEIKGSGPVKIEGATIDLN